MWIKICGITSPSDAIAVQDAGANAIGLNFYSKSMRFVEPDPAVAIADCVRESLEIVGVFVNTDPPDVAAVCDQVGLTAVQFHGDETTKPVAEFQALRPDIAVIRAVRIGRTTASLADQLDPWTTLDPPLDAILVDSFVAGEYGGTGEAVAPQLLDPKDVFTRMILAGGLTPDNVTEAALAVLPWGIDTASGVETEPGRKSHSSIREFVQACRSVESERSSERLRS